MVIKYKIAPETFIEYEGKIVDKRVGSEDKESYVELKDALTLNAEGKIVAIEKMKRLTDSFIEAGFSRLHWTLETYIFKKWMLMDEISANICHIVRCFVDVHPEGVPLHRQAHRET